MGDDVKFTREPFVQIKGGNKRAAPTTPLTRPVKAPRVAVPGPRGTYSRRMLGAGRGPHLTRRNNALQHTSAYTIWVPPNQGWVRQHPGRDQPTWAAFDQILGWFRPSSTSFGTPSTELGVCSTQIGRFRSISAWVSPVFWCRPNLCWFRPVASKFRVCLDQSSACFGHIRACFGQFHSGFDQRSGLVSITFVLVSSKFRRPACLLRLCAVTTLYGQDPCSLGTSGGPAPGELYRRSTTRVGETGHAVEVPMVGIVQGVFGGDRNLATEAAGRFLMWQIPAVSRFGTAPNTVCASFFGRDPGTQILSIGRTFTRTMIDLGGVGRFRHYFDQSAANLAIAGSTWANL